MKRIAVVVAAVGLGGCASAIQSSLYGMTLEQANDAGYVAQSTTVEHDPYKATTSYVSKPLANELGSRVFLRATKFDNDDSEDPQILQLYVALRNNGWMFPNSAYVAGQRFDVLRIGSDVNCSQYGCTNYEDVAVNISPEQLASWTKGGLNIQISGRSGDQAFYLNPNYIIGFKSAVYGTPVPASASPIVSNETGVGPTG